MARVTLSFDNGPHPEGTPRVLDALAARGLSATFFAIGRRLAAPGGLDLARRIVDAGHRLGGHTWSHTPLGDSGRPKTVVAELARTQALIDEVYDGEALFRPVGGGGQLGPHLLSEAAVQWLVEHRVTCVTWNSVPRDWVDPDDWMPRVLSDADAMPHQLVVLHDGYPDVMRHLGAYLDCAIEGGHTFTREFPPSCLPIVRGQEQPGLRDLVRSPHPSAKATHA